MAKVKVYEQDYSPEGSSFYAKHAMQYDTSFIETVTNNDLNPYAEEDEVIARIDGDDVVKDKLASIRDESNSELLQELLTNLSEKEFTIVTMRAHGATYEEIGKAIGHQQGWTFTLHKRIIEKLQVCAEELLRRGE